MRHIAIIPARAGSKSIINKNLQKLKAETLVAKAVRGAREAGVFKEILLTTDIPDLLSSVPDGAKIIERDLSLAQDDSLVADVVMEVVRKGCLKESDVLWLLQPTSPFRQPHDFLAIAKMIENQDVRSVISVCDVGANHPNRVYSIVNSRRGSELMPLRYTNFDNKQELPTFYIRNGCFYVVRCSDFLDRKSFYVKTCAPYVMSRNRSVNIDEYEDLALARLKSGQSVWFSEEKWIK